MKYIIRATMSQLWRVLADSIYIFLPLYIGANQMRPSTRVSVVWALSPRFKKVISKLKIFLIFILY